MANLADVQTVGAFGDNRAAVLLLARSAVVDAPTAAHLVAAHGRIIRSVLDFNRPSFAGRNNEISDQPVSVTCGTRRGCVLHRAGNVERFVALDRS